MASRVAQVVDASFGVYRFNESRVQVSVLPQDRGAALLLSASF